jgi:hypothetical protein
LFVCYAQTLKLKCLGLISMHGTLLLITHGSYCNEHLALLIHFSLMEELKCYNTNKEKKLEES